MARLPDCQKMFGDMFIRFGRIHERDGQTETDGQTDTVQQHRPCLQGDHSPDNVEFPAVRGTRHVKCYSYHARTSTKYMYGCKYAAYNQQF